MIKAIEIKSGEYCHYQGFGKWTLNQRYGEPEPKETIVAATWYDSGETTGEEYITLINSTANNRLSIDGHVVMSEAYITENVDIHDMAPKVKLRIKGDSNFTLEILDTSVEPPISRLIKIERFSLPEPGPFLKWPEFDEVFRRQIGQKEIS